MATKMRKLLPGQVIRASITEDSRGWAYSVYIGGSFHKLGFGVDFLDAAKMAKKGVESAQRYVQDRNATRVLEWDPVSDICPMCSAVLVRNEDGNRECACGFEHIDLT